MNEKNFDALKNIKVPQAWLDKAAAIPEEYPRKRAAFPLYRIAAAASIVLVSVIGVLIFLFFGKSAPIVMRDSESAVSESVTDETVVGTTTATEPAETVAVLSTDAQGNTIVRYIEASDANTSGIQPTESQSASDAPTAKQNGTEKPSPTAPATEWVITPTEAPKGTDPPKPTSPPATQEPTESYRPPGDTEFYGTFSIVDSETASGSGWNVAEDITVFCRLYDSNGNLVGDSPLYHPQREAVILSRFSDGTVCVYYDPVVKGLQVTEDGYEYVFYDVHGNELYRNIKFVF